MFTAFSFFLQSQVLERRLLTAFLFLFIGCATPGFAQQNKQDRDRNQPVVPFRIIGNVYYVGASDITSYLITSPQGHILIDGGFKETAPQIKANIERLGFKLKDVKILLINHAHYDHCAGLAALKKWTGAKLYANPNDMGVLEDGGVSDFRFGGDHPLFEPVKVDVSLKDGQEITLGSTTLHTYFTPGHTKGATTWVMTATEGGRAYKVVFASSVSTLDYQLLNNKKYPQIATDFATTFETLSRLQPDVFLGSHGQFFDLLGKLKKMKAGARRNPFIDPKGYQLFVAQNKKSFEENEGRQVSRSKH